MLGLCIIILLLPIALLDSHDVLYLYRLNLRIVYEMDEGQNSKQLFKLNELVPLYYKY